MNLFITLEGTLTQTRAMGPSGVNVSFLWQNPDDFIHFIISIIISVDLTSYFLEMIMLICLKGNPDLNQNGER